MACDHCQRNPADNALMQRFEIVVVDDATFTPTAQESFEYDRRVVAANAAPLPDQSSSSFESIAQI